MDKLMLALSQALRLLPTFIIGIETLSGKNTGVSKKDAVKALAQGAIQGAAVGYAVADNPATAQAIAGFAPVVDTAIDSIVADFNATGLFVKSAPAPVAQSVAA